MPSVKLVKIACICIQAASEVLVQTKIHMLTNNKTLYTYVCYVDRLHELWHFCGYNIIQSKNHAKKFVKSPFNIKLNQYVRKTYFQRAKYRCINQMAGYSLITHLSFWFTTVLSAVVIEINLYTTALDSWLCTESVTYINLVSAYGEFTILPFCIYLCV